MMFTGIYGKAALDTLGVINDQPANSGPDCFSYFLEHQLITEPHSLRQDSQVEH